MDALRILVWLGKEMGLIGEPLRAWVNEKQDEMSELRAEERQKERVKAQEVHEREMILLETERASLEAALQQIDLAAGDVRSSSGNSDDTKQAASDSLNTSVMVGDTEWVEDSTNAYLNVVMSSGLGEPTSEERAVPLTYGSSFHEPASADHGIEALNNVFEYSDAYTYDATDVSTLRLPKFDEELEDVDEMVESAMNLELGGRREHEDKEIPVGAFRSSDESLPLTRNMQGCFILVREDKVNEAIPQECETVYEEQCEGESHVTYTKEMCKNEP
ncbi:hypothetical protein HPB50_019678 [Hyalomma asiaticum]|uniref:Uncharacterized protein n=1 Tax=Hyalomma asiaticum TaxID=266040 RepID=A0ACB7RVP2_HYAAI|nr:hypothetical protein HPB50_019678 [Hyalomma asiaticum]